MRIEQKCALSVLYLMYITLKNILLVKREKKGPDLHGHDQKYCLSGDLVKKQFKATVITYKQLQTT